MDKTVLGIPLFHVKSIEDYWMRLEESMVFLEHMLQHKHEYGTSAMCSERGIQTSLAYSAFQIARQEGCNPHMAKCICFAVGLCFPKFGSCGMAACANYFQRHEIPWSLTDLKIGASEHCIAKTASVVTPQLDEALHAYYENRTDIPEVNVARFCQVQIRESRELMKRGMPAAEAIPKILRRAEQSFSVEQSLLSSDDPELEVPDVVQKSIDADLDDFIKFYGLPTGILEMLA